MTWHTSGLMPRGMRAKALRCTCALIVAIGITVTGCAREGDRSSAPAVGAGTDEAAVSLYDLDIALIDADGRVSRLADLGGRVLVVAMIYTSCQSVCPRLTEDMKSIENLLPAKDLERSDFVLFSLDPGRDTPEALGAFARSHRLDRSRWRLFATSEESVIDLAAALGVKHRRDESGEIAHSAVLFVLDRDGVVRHRQLGLGEDPRPLIDALRAASG